MKYKNIFQKIPKCDSLSLRLQYSIDSILKTLPIYQEYCIAKVALRKQFEKEYKSKFQGISFRLFISKFGADFPTAVCDPIGLTKEDVQDIENRYLAFISDSKEKIEYCVEYIRSHLVLTDFLKESGLEEYLTSISLLKIKSLFNAEVYLKVCFYLNKKSIDKIITNLADDENSQYQDPAISYQGKEVFSSITHEDYYWWLSDNGDR